jgi:glycosyltransferase involved in cell wall biosynthesis
VRRIEDFSLLDRAPAPADRLADVIGRSGPIVLYVGNLERYQGIDLLLEGFAHAHPAVPEAQLVVIGGQAGDVARYRDRARALGVADCAHFLGPRPSAALAGYLDQAAVVASPRIRGQNTPMKVYSYLDSGRPVIATRLPTHTQVLDDAIALLVDPEPRAMGEGLARLLRDAALRERLATAAKARVREEFSHDAFRRKVTAFYDEVERALRAPAQGRA